MLPLPPLLSNPTNPGPWTPSCRFVQGTELWDNIKKFAMASFAMKATERDPEFVDNFCKVGGQEGEGERKGGGGKTPDKGVEDGQDDRSQGL